MNRKIILALSFVVLPISARAQARTGPYISVAAGFNKMQQEDVDAHLNGSPAPATPGEILTEVGPALVGSLGMSLSRALRVEIEGSYLSNKITSETGLSGENNASGTERKMGVMGNAFYEFGSGMITPYLGGGAGMQWVHEPAATASNGGYVVTSTAQTKSSFAYQAIAGVAYPIESIHGLSISAEYRYLGLAGTRVYTATVTVPGQGSFPLTDESTNDVNHSLLFGIRYAFGQ